MQLIAFKRVLVVAGMGALACAIDAESEGAGKACSADGRCLAGYFCNTERRCVANAAHQDAAAGSAGTGADGGDGGTGTGGADGDGGTGAGGDSGSGAAAGGQGGTALDADTLDADSEVSLPDAGGQDGALSDAGPADSDASPSDAGCMNPTRYYMDADRDGFGRDDTTQWACAKPTGSWATRGADCNDADNRVFPGQTAFFGTGVAVSAGVSFDYDCSGSEQSDPAQPGPAPNCSALTVAGCGGSGFEPTGRSGPLTNPICGSTKLVECAPALLVCSARTSTVEPKRCR